MEFTVRFLCRVQFPRRGAQRRKATSKNPLRLTVLTFVDKDSGRDIAASKNFSTRQKTRSRVHGEGTITCPVPETVADAAGTTAAPCPETQVLTNKALARLVAGHCPGTFPDKGPQKRRTVVVSRLHNMTCDRSADAFPGCPSASVAGQTHAQEGFSRTFSGKRRCVRTITRHECRAY